MKNKRLISKILIGILLCSNLFSSTVFAESNSSLQKTDTEIHGLGALPFDKEGWDWYNNYVIHVKQSKINEVGIERINASRKSSNLKELSTTDTRYIVSRGNEIVPQTTNTVLNSLMKSSNNASVDIDVKSFLATDLKNYTPHIESNVVKDSTALSSVSTSTTHNGRAPLESDGLPAWIDNSLNNTNPYDTRQLGYFPPIMNQGNIGSCVACATTYYQMTYQYSFANHLNASNAPIFSPKFTYDINNQTGNYTTGLSPSSVYESLKYHGAPISSLFPYSYNANNPSANYIDWPSSVNIWRDALKHVADSTCTVDINNGETSNTNPVKSPTDSHLFNTKLMLANGYILTMGTSINGWKKDTSNVGCFYAVDRLIDSNTKQYIPNQYHQMTIVGYDDTKTINANGTILTGAFKIANSWGTNSTWSNGDNGFAWLAYDALNQNSKLIPNDTNRMAAFDTNNQNQNNVYGLIARSSYTPKLLVQFTANTRDRSQFASVLQYSDKNTLPPKFQNFWSPQVPNGNGGKYSFNGTSTPTDCTFLLDYRSLIENKNISDINSKNWYFIVSDNSKDGQATTIKNIKFVDGNLNVLLQPQNSSAVMDGTSSTFTLPAK